MSEQPAPTQDVLHKPIIVLGSPRSGTTFLCQLLGAHRDVRLFDEPRFVWRYGNDWRSDMLRPEHARPDVKAYIRDHFQAKVREAGKMRMVEKHPSNALRLGFVDRIFPDCKVIHIIRNGYDSVLSVQDFWENRSDGLQVVTPGRVSQRRRELRWWRYPAYTREIVQRVAPARMRKLVGKAPWGPRVPGLRGLMKELTARELSCVQWRMCVEQACAYGDTMPQNRYFELRLEALDEPTVRRLLAFCELPDDQRVLERMAERFDGSAASARSKASSPEALAELRSWVEPTMCWLNRRPSAAGLAATTQGGDAR